MLIDFFPLLCKGTLRYCCYCCLLLCIDANDVATSPSSSSTIGTIFKKREKKNRPDPPTRPLKRRPFVACLFFICEFIKKKKGKKRVTKNCHRRRRRRRAPLGRKYRESQGGKEGGIKGVRPSSLFFLFSSLLLSSPFNPLCKVAPSRRSALLCSILSYANRARGRRCCVQRRFMNIGSSPFSFEAFASSSSSSSSLNAFHSLLIQFEYSAAVVHSQSSSSSVAAIDEKNNNNNKKRKSIERKKRNT